MQTWESKKKKKTLIFQNFELVGKRQTNIFFFLGLILFRQNFEGKKKNRNLIMSFINSYP